MKQPREYFPKMPKDVFESWIEPAIKEYGWPFNSENDSVYGTRYEKLLKQKPLSHWASLSWHPVELDLESVSWSPTVFMQISGVQSNHPSFRHIANSQSRLNNFCRIIEKTGTVPKRIVVIKNGFFYDVLDGIHRLAALYKIGKKNSPFKVGAWIGSEKPEPDRVGNAGFARL